MKNAILLAKNQEYVSQKGEKYYFSTKYRISAQNRIRPWQLPLECLSILCILRGNLEVLPSEIERSSNQSEKNTNLKTTRRIVHVFFSILPSLL